MKLSTIIAVAKSRLTAAGIDDPALDVRLLIAHALSCDRLTLVTESARVLSENEIAAIDALIARREKREPVHRILGCREFWGLPFGLNEATLEPRPDSETLIEVAVNILFPSLRATPAKAGGSAAIHLLQSPPESLSAILGDGLPRRVGDAAAPRNDGIVSAPPFHLLDLGTGTGCLLLSLLHEWPNATGLGIDKAPRAVEQVTLNAQRLGVEDRVVFRTGDWLEGTHEKFDLILCNPPYIPVGDIDTLQPEVREHDPRAALDGGADGLDPYRHLIPLLPQFLNAQGAVIFEVGAGQAEVVAKLMQTNGFEAVTTTNDLGGVARCVSGRKALQ